jgi:hypothetical protein
LNNCIRNGHDTHASDYTLIRAIEGGEDLTSHSTQSWSVYHEKSHCHMAALLLSANALAAIKIDGRQASNMDDVQSLGVIYINHNFATESEADQALNEETDAQGAKYYHVILIREPGSNGNMHASADIYR